MTPAYGGGPDLIARTTVTSSTWTPLPAIPGISKIVSAALTPRGDVYAIGQNTSGTSLWRYRTGQGWRQMPDAPAGVALSSLSAGGEERLICRGSDNTLLILPLGAVGDALEWGAVNAPAGKTLQDVASHPQGKRRDYATVTDASGQVGVAQYDHDADAWTVFPAATAVQFDPITGAVLGSGGAVPNFGGGLTVDKTGRIFAGSNPPGAPPVVYSFQPTVEGANTGTWSPLPAVPALEWEGTIVSNPSGFNTSISNLKTDDQGRLWAQLTNPSGKYSMVHMGTTPLTLP